MSPTRLAIALILLIAACSEAPTTGAPLPVLDDLGESGWAAVGTGRDHTCALTTSGEAYCWGSNEAGQLLQPSGGPERCALANTGPNRACSPDPVRVLPSLRFRELSVGAVHACAIADDRTVHCWGDNSSGQLGDVEPRTGSVQVASTLGFADVSAGADHSCAIRTDGVLFCWGNNNRGQLGTGTKQASSLPLRVSTNLRFASVSAGEGRTCARTLAGTVFCWGSVWLYREGGLEYSRDQTVPASVPGAGAMTAVTVGTFSTCATDAKGVVHCWEANPFGQLGNGTTDGSTTPLPVASDERFVSVSAGIIQTCAVAVSGIGYCWGNDSFGQLGVSPTTLAERCSNPTLSCSTRPIPVFGRQQFTSISTGFGNHSCGVSTKRNIYCWGLAWLGQLGGGMATYREVIPVLARPPLAMSTR